MPAFLVAAVPAGLMSPLGDFFDAGRIVPFLLAFMVIYPLVALCYVDMRKVDRLRIADTSLRHLVTRRLSVFGKTFSWSFSRNFTLDDRAGMQVRRVQRFDEVGPGWFENFIDISKEPDWRIARLGPLTDDEAARLQEEIAQVFPKFARLST